MIDMKKALVYMVVCVILFMSLIPFLWFVNTSLKSTVEITTIPPVLFPAACF